VIAHPIFPQNLAHQDDGFLDDDEADQIEPGYIVRRVKKKEFSGEELEGWDHYPSTEYVQVCSPRLSLSLSLSLASPCQTIPGMRDGTLS
jgi:hypothetical protein